MCFSDVFGKNSRSIIHCILEHPREVFDVAPFVDRRCKHPIEEIQAAVDGAVSREQAAKLKECIQHIDELNDHKKNIEKEILHLAEPCSWQLDLIRTIPDFSSDLMTVIAVISEIGINISVFPTAKNLVFLVTSASLDSAITFFAFREFIGFDNSVCNLYKQRL